MNGSDNVIPYPNFNVPNIPEALRKVANDIEANPEICSRVILCGQRSDGTIWRKAFGKDFHKAHAIGIMEFVKHGLITED